MDGPSLKYGRLSRGGVIIRTICGCVKRLRTERLGSGSMGSEWAGTGFSLSDSITSTS